MIAERYHVCFVNHKYYNNIMRIDIDHTFRFAVIFKKRSTSYVVVGLWRLNQNVHSRNISARIGHVYFVYLLISISLIEIS